jgi:hypothetical protein
MMRVAGKSLNGAVQLAGILVGLWALVMLNGLAQPTPSLATELQQCVSTLPACGCNACGEIDHGRPSCPPGQSLYDDYCLPDCPTGFIRYPGLPGLCIPPVEFGCPEGFEQVPLPGCPQGYVRDLREPDRCIPDIGLLQNAGECPYGMAWSNETGRCEVDCPQGTYRDGHGLCQSFYGRVCPEGYTRDNETGRCLPPGIWPPGYGWVCLPACPQGYYRDIRHPTRCLPPPPSCPQGFVDVNGRCLPDCDRGITRDNYGYCVPPPCPDGSFTNLRGQCQPIPCPDGTTRNSEGRCVPPQTGCPQESETYNGKCVPICKDGLVRDNNGRCMPPPSNKPPVIKCKDYEVKDASGRCVPVQQQPDCPRGYKIDANGDCTRIIRQVPLGCPEGTYLNRRTKSCVPLQYDPGNTGGDYVPPAVNRPPPIMLNPGILKQLAPQGGDGGLNIQTGCPTGQYRDNNGRCVGK